MPGCVQDTMLDTAIASHGPDERCGLLSLPSALLRLWPMERVVVGLMVCHHLRRELSEHADKILLVKRAKADASTETLRRDFLRISHLNVVLKWQGEPAGLACLASLGTSLTQLDLSFNEIGGTGAGRLAGVLGECRALAHLDLGGCHIGAEGAGRLAGVLGGCRALAHLDLSFNQIGDDGAGRLAGVLGECLALAHLRLSYNRIGAEGAGRLAGALGGCNALVHLNLYSNEIGDEGAARLAGVLGACRAVRRNGIGAAWEERLADAGQDNCKIITLRSRWRGDNMVARLTSGGGGVEKG